MGPGGVLSQSSTRTKLFLIVGAIILVIMGVIVALGLFFGGSTLTKYTNSEEGYSILVPTAYTTIGSGKDVQFFKSGTENNTDSSFIRIVTNTIVNVDNLTDDALVAEIDSNIQTAVDKTNSASETNGIGNNMIISKSNSSDLTIWTQTADLLVDGKTAGQYQKITYLSGMKMYSVEITSYNSESILQDNMTKIIDSFTVQ